MPDADNPRSKEMKWLSRGLFEALIRFIGLAGDGMGLRAALYEFHYQPVANAFAKALEAGADVKIVYDAESSLQDRERDDASKTARLDDNDAVIPRTVTEGIRHNKFIVLLDERPRRSRSGRARPTFQPAASSATPTSATSCGTRASRRSISTTGSVSPTT